MKHETLSVAILIIALAILIIPLRLRLLISYYVSNYWLKNGKVNSKFFLLVEAFRNLESDENYEHPKKIKIRLFYS